MTEGLTAEAVLDRIRDETRAAVLEGDASDCSSADCIADAVYEICRVQLTRQLLAAQERVAALRESLDAVVANYRMAGWCDCNDHWDQLPYPHRSGCPVVTANLLLLAEHTETPG